MNKIPQSDYQSFFKEIKEKIHQAQLKAMQAANRELLSLYTDIGKSIVDKQENLGWGKTVVKNLSRDLQKDFPGIKGFSVANLWRMENSHRWCEKLGSPIILLFWKNAKMTLKGSFTSG